MEPVKSGSIMIGEPFVCQDLTDYVARAKKLGYEYIYLPTNGTLATLDRCKELIAAGLSSIKFSLNAATRESYLDVHGTDDFLTVKENIFALKKYVEEHKIGLPMFISFIKNERNKNDIEKLKEQFEDVVDQIYVLPAATRAGECLG